jgi:hypothetical protein
MGCAVYIRCALSIHQKECRKSLGCALYIGARYLPENMVIKCLELKKDQFRLWNLRHLWLLWLSETCHCVVWQVLTDISYKSALPIYIILIGCSRFLWNVCRWQQDCTVSHPRNQKSSSQTGLVKVLLWHWVLTGFKCWLLTVVVKNDGHLFGLKVHLCSLLSFWRWCSLSRYSV